MRSPMRVCVRAHGCRIRGYLMQSRMVRQGASQDGHMAHAKSAAGEYALPLDALPFYHQGPCTGADLNPKP